MITSADMEQKLPKALIRLILCYALALIGFVVLVVADVITPRVFGILCIIAMVSFGVVIYRILRTTVPSSSQAEKIIPAWSRRRRWFVVSAASLWLVFALWNTRGGAWFPRLVGATVLISVVAALVIALSKDRPAGG
jgi:hypothetical protein